jgi:hypothetical protein
MVEILVKGVTLKQGMGECKAALKVLSLVIKTDSFRSVPVFRPDMGVKGRMKSLLAGMDNKYGNLACCMSC